jgi:hypothetical protein
MLAQVEYKHDKGILGEYWMETFYSHIEECFE